MPLPTRAEKQTIYTIFKRVFLTSKTNNSFDKDVLSDYVLDTFSKCQGYSTKQTAWIWRETK